MHPRLSVIVSFCIGVAGAPAAIQSVPTPAIAVLGHDVTVRPLTDSSWLVMSVSDIPGFGPVSSNAVLIVGREGSVLADVPVTVEQTDVVLSWADTALQRPVHAVIATHAHSDRIGGLPAAKRRGIPTYASAKTIDLAPKNGFVVPDNALPDEGAVTLAGRWIEVFYPGPGHSPDNIVLWLADERLLIGACLVKAAAARNIGFTGDADLPGWRRAIDLLTQRYVSAATVVPGHGEVGGPELLTWTKEIVDAAIAASAKR